MTSFDNALKKWWRARLKSASSSWEPERTFHRYPTPHVVRLRHAFVAHDYTLILTSPCDTATKPPTLRIMTSRVPLNVPPRTPWNVLPRSPLNVRPRVPLNVRPRVPLNVRPRVPLNVRPGIQQNVLSTVQSVIQAYGLSTHLSSSQ